MGGACFEVLTPMAERVISRAAEAGVYFERVERISQREMRAWVAGKSERAFCEFLDRFSIAYTVTARRGWHRALNFMRARLALAASLALAITLLCLCAGRVWLIRVSGASDPEALVALLEDWGVRPGSSRADIDPVALSKRLNASAPEYAFIGVKLSGVYLRLDAVREHAAPAVYDILDARDLVADADAVITRVHVVAGQARVKAGDTVRAGDILIAGEELRTADGETARVRAEGSVYARAWTRATSSFALEREQLAYTGRASHAARIESPLFTRELFGDNPFTSFTESRERLAIVGLFVPASIVRSTYRECESAIIRVSEREAALCAEASALAGARARASADAREEAAWTQCDIANGMVTAVAVVEWTREITCEAGG